MKFKRRLVKVGSYEVYTKITLESDLGEPSDEWGRKHVCKYDGDHPGNMHVCDELMGYGSGATETDAVKAFVADCFRMLKHS